MKHMLMLLLSLVVVASTGGILWWFFKNLSHIEEVLWGTKRKEAAATPISEAAALAGSESATHDETLEE
jgi:hypothetical protein